jgi:hypothetical protein
MKITLTHTFITISRNYITHSSEHSVPNSRLHLSDLPVFSLRFPVQNWLRTPVQHFLRQKVISEHLDACRVFGKKWCEMSVTQRDIYFLFTSCPHLCRWSSTWYHEFVCCHSINSKSFNPKQRDIIEELQYRFS